MYFTLKVMIINKFVSALS